MHWAANVLPSQEEQNDQKKRFEARQRDRETERVNDENKET